MPQVAVINLTRDALAGPSDVWGQSQAVRLRGSQLHDLRHGAATLALASGADLKVVQATLGHASIVLTADTYTSVLPQLYHQSATATAQLVLAAARKTARDIRERAA